MRYYDADAVDKMLAHIVRSNRNQSRYLELALPQDSLYYGHVSSTAQMILDVLHGVGYEVVVPEEPARDEEED